MITTIKEGGSLRAALFFVQKNPLPKLIADMGTGARFHILSQRKKMIWAAIKKSATTNDSGYGCRGTPLLKD